MTRLISALLAALFAANALAMLAAPAIWYGVVPGVPATGPFNAHFVRDIGAAYLVASLGLAWFSLSPLRAWPALVCAAVFLCAHAAIHLHDALLSPVCGQDLVRDLPGVFAPALIAAVLAVLARPRASLK